MTEVILEYIAPIAGFFFLGKILRLFKVFGLADGHRLLRFVFYIFLPALSFHVVANAPLSRDLMIVPFMPLAAMIVNFALVGVFLKFYPQTRAMVGVFFCAALAMKSSFILPFALAFYGEDGFRAAVFFDIGNLFFIFTFVYFLAVKHSEKGIVCRKQIVRKFLGVPVLWAFLLGFLVVLFKIELPAPVGKFFEKASYTFTPLIMLAMGLSFNPKLKQIKMASVVMAIRMVGGFLCGLLITSVIPMDDLYKKVVVIGCAAPCGFTALIFAAQENHDECLASTCVSLSILMGMVYIPFVVWLLG